MDIIQSPSEMQKWSQAAHRAGRTIGLVPTMGALHEGHLSLVAQARTHADAAVMSIFVNPMQFGPAEDFNRYPRPLEADCNKAAEAGCDALFVPQKSDMYPEGFSTQVTVEALSARLCGASRPAHFCGVATVVLKLFNIVAPDIACFGQKDAQQVIVLRRMVQDLNVPVTINVCPTVRERDGLAMSSRNAYLTPAERTAAPVIYKGLQAARALYDKGERNAADLSRAIEDLFRAAPCIRKEYIEIVDCANLQPLASVASAALIAAACRTAESNTRLIDNVVIGGSL